MSFYFHKKLDIVHLTFAVISLFFQKKKKSKTTIIKKSNTLLYFYIYVLVSFSKYFFLYYTYIQYKYSIFLFEKLNNYVNIHVFSNIQYIEYINIYIYLFIRHSMYTVKITVSFRDITSE